jgi:RNA polymerase sigma factor (sigma-70 family)
VWPVRVAPIARRNRRARGRVVRVVVGRPLSEHELVERARRGDADAFGELVRVHEEIAFRTAVLITGNAADAQEAAQDAFVKAHRGLSRFRAGEPLRPWLLMIVANEARNLRRSRGRRAALALRAAGEERHSRKAAPSPETALLAGERRATLLDAIGRLREPDRLVIGCRYLLELSEAETAAALGVARGTVKSRVSRALERLREEVGRDD